MIKAGITGNIGSGKTTVARIFEALGAAVFNADEEARKLINEPAQLKMLVERFGKNILDEHQLLDRKKFAQLIFNDKQALEFVNGLIHPLVRNAFAGFCRDHEKSALCIYEAAILIETGYYKQLDRIILVTSPEKLSIERVVQRDSVTADQVKQRMRNQWPEERKKQFADFIIVNDSINPLLDQCLKVYEMVVGSRQ